MAMHKMMFNAKGLRELTRKPIVKIRAAEVKRGVLAVIVETADKQGIRR